MAYPTVPAHPSFPQLENEVLDFWAADGTFEASVDARPAGDNGSNEFVFYDGPPFANGLPHYGHLLTGYVKDVVPRYQTMRGQPRRAALRLGHPRPARRDRDREAARPQEQVRDRRDGRGRVQRRLPRVGAALHRRVARLRHPPGPLGRLRQRLQDPRPGLHGIASCGPSRRCGTRVWSTRASASSGTAGTTAPRCRPPRPRWTTSTSTGRTRPSPSACGCRRRAPISTRRSRWSGPPRRGRCRPTSRWR